MAHHKSCKKRIRQDIVKRTRYRYYRKTTRTLVRKLRESEDATEAGKLLPFVVSWVDKLAKYNQIHSKKASNLKSKLMKHVNTLKAA